jgi:hypothetical protein
VSLGRSEPTRASAFVEAIGVDDNRQPTLQPSVDNSLEQFVGNPGCLPIVLIPADGCLKMAQ